MPADSTGSDPAPRQPPRNGIFVTTRWTRVLASRGDSPEARQALGDLCAAYYTPVFICIRRAAPDEDTARDLTQEFFARILSGRGLQHADPRRGRFRYFLLGAVRHFLADVRDHQGRLKRGGGQAHIPLDAGTDTSPGLEVPDGNLPDPDLEFDRKWALTLLERALNRLQREQTEAGKSAAFEALKPWLAGDQHSVSPVDTAQQLGLSEGAFKVALHRLRKRFREFVREEIGNTVDDPGQAREELRYLLEVLSASASTR